MLTMRTIEQASKIIKGRDEKTALTKHAIRQLVISGELPSVRVGNKYLLSMEALEQYLLFGTIIKVQEETPQIRRIEVRG